MDEYPTRHSAWQQALATQSDVTKFKVKIIKWMLASALVGVCLFAAIAKLWL